MNQSLKPRSDFRASQFAKAHESLVTNSGFRFAVQQALLAYVTDLKAKAEGSDSAANWNKAEGAMEFTDILLNIAESPEPPKEDKKKSWSLSQLIRT